ncbi:MAG: EamA family transporter [Candidatus Promineifilaceae bacterium]
MESATLSIIFGLSSALVWGAGDFSGGLATKHNDVYTVVLFGHLIGLFGLVGLAIVTGEQMPTSADLFYGGLAGLGGMLGVLAFYSSLSRSPMGIVAPVTALVNAIIPLVFALFVEGLPPLVQGIGIVAALIAVWFLSGAGKMTNIRLSEFGLPVLAGFGFAMFIILIDRVSEGAVFWPLSASRVASVLFIVGVLTLSKKRSFAQPVRLWIIALSGIFDAAGNAFFAFAAQAGRLDIASILTSLYPASTVFLAWVLLGERLSGSQKWGVVLALAALILITL